MLPKHKIILLILTLLLAGMPGRLAAQDELMDLLNSEETEPQVNYTTATFKATRIINGHSIERMQEGQLDVRFHHRFGTLNNGAYEMFGLDQANVHYSLEYGLTDWFMFGVGRDTYQKTFDGFGKFSLLRQSTGAVEMPVSVSALATVAVNTLRWAEPDRQNYFSSRLAYTYEVLVARKFSERFSFQVTGAVVHKNLVASELDYNDLFALGGGERFKITKRMSLNAEYIYPFFPKFQSGRDLYHPSLSLGIDIETGGHVFQIMLTNSTPMIEKGFITETTGRWLDGDIHLGFNISRVFTLK